MWELKNWCFWTVVLEKTLKVFLELQGDQLVNPKGNQPWIFIGRTDAKPKAPILDPSAVKSWLIGKGPDAGTIWRQGEKGMTEGEIIGWHHLLNGHEFEQTPMRWWRMGKLGMLKSMGLQRVRHNWTATSQIKDGSLKF